MDYEQFSVKSDKCACDTQVRGAVLIVSAFYILVNLVLNYREVRREKLLQQENETLKNIVLKSVDNALVRMMKNGNNSEDEHDD